VNSASKTILCDGCGEPASPEHLRQRVERLEFATRFRPIHIDCLVLYPSPPQRIEDYFYRPSASAGVRSSESRSFFEALMAAIGVSAKDDREEAALLVEFQRAGWFLAECCECPMDRKRSETVDWAKEYGPSLIRRTKFSYMPKHIVFLSIELAPLASLFAREGLREKLLLADGGPFDCPPFDNEIQKRKFASLFRAVLPQSVAHSGASEKSE
jgi:hypothetical protein